MEWQQDTTSYLTFAENDYCWFADQYNRGIRAPGMASLGQNICERYLKHIIDQFYAPENEDEEIQKIRVLRTHNLPKLSNFISENMGIEVPEQLTNDLSVITSFYFTTRYPGDDSVIPTESDIECVAESIVLTRSFTLDVIHQIEHSNEQNIENSDIDIDDDFEL